MQSIQASGNLIPAKQIPVNSPIAGTLVELRVKQGDAVKEGDILGKIVVADAEGKRLDAQQRLIKARIDLEQAKANPPDQAAVLAEAEMNLERLRIEMGRAQRHDYERDLFLSKRDADRAAANAKNIRWLWEQTKWRDTPDVWKLGGDAELAEDTAEKARERYQELVDSKDLRERESQLQQRRIEVAERQITTIKQTAELQKTAYEVQIELLKSAVAESQKALERIDYGTELRSPITGMVTALNAGAGDIVDPTRTLLTVAEPKVAKAAVNLTEADVVNITINQVAAVNVPALGEAAYEAKVSWIAASAQLGKEPTFQIILDIIGMDNRAKVGMTASARIAIDRRDNVLLVPNSAIRSRQGRRFVEAVVGGEFKEVPVELGFRAETETEVLSGLSDGQLVVVGSRPAAESSRQ
ncbi:MAG: HlyD family efflux transporter periplasmic adaptor subunit [Chloroflexi bacterium]|nr:HlyD family efflux transporter periplasmic adaptor subunit [Chloroflexota bacterium]